MLSVRAVMLCSRGLSTIACHNLKLAGVAANRSRQQAPATVNALPTDIAALYPFFPAQQRCFANKASDSSITGQERVYYGSLAPRMKAVKIFSLTTSLAGLAAQPVLMEHGMKLGGTGMAVFLCGFAGFFTFVTPLLLHFVTKKYVTEIHYNPATKEYTATTISLILKKIQTKFRPSDVKVPEVPGMFTSFTIGKRALFVDPMLFEDPEHYVRIMGYDKPIDFKLDLSESSPAMKKTEKPVKQ